MSLIIKVLSLTRYFALGGLSERGLFWVDQLFSKRQFSRVRPLAHLKTFLSEINSLMMIIFRFFSILYQLLNLFWRSDNIMGKVDDNTGNRALASKPLVVLSLLSKCIFKYTSCYADIIFSSFPTNRQA